MAKNNFTKAVNSLFDRIGCQKTYMSKSDMCSGNKYFITISYKDKHIGFVFHDNYLNQSSKKDFLYCLIDDARAFENCRNLVEFMREFGYTEASKARKAYNGCMKQSERLHKLFTDEEIALLSMIVSE